ncbi:hypothetical protein DPMN_039781 [Dreissena polymorpha]|uniref:Uncharacterized protein n=1 Tax=Dreissena polymorpha TaxID=45954 RepID=A0A9D4CVW6_DREPO|nr:hypothetical protein DPMN_039781 [Dreissena polymorpha]
MVIIGIFLLAFGRLVAGVCNTKTGPAGSLECVAFKDYNYKYQWSTCLSDAYIQRKSGGTHQCVDRTAVYCYYQCMLESHELGEGPVYYDCACDPNSPLKSPLPAKCYSPDGTDCSWYKECLEAKYPCKESGSSYAIGFGDKFCTLYDQHKSKFDTTGQQWIDAVRRCLQVALVPLIRQYTSVSCSTIKMTAYESHSACYTNPYPGAPSICTLGAKNLFQVFVTVKSAFVDDFFATGDQLLETALKCGGLYTENAIKIVMQGVYTTTDYIDNVYNKVMKGLRSYFKNKLTSLADDVFFAPFIPNITRNRRSAAETNINVIFLPRAEYDMNYNGNPDVNVTAALDRVMDAIENGEIYLGLPTRSVSQCINTGCTTTTRTVIPPPPRAGAELESLASLTVILTGVLVSQYACLEYFC